MFGIFPDAFVTDFDHELFVVELELPLFQERDDFLEGRWFTEEHRLHSGIVVLQRFETVLGWCDAQRTLGGFAKTRPTRFEEKVLVLGNTSEQFRLSGRRFGHALPDQLMKVAVVAREAVGHRLVGRAMKLRVQDGRLFPEGPFR